MSIDIYATPYKFNKLKKYGFDMALGYWFWNIAVLIAPYDTGNLRSAITLKRNKPKNIRISYSTFMANYILFLEKGWGPVRKYKDFIKKDTVETIAEQLVSWIITGRRPKYARQGLKPFIQLSASNHEPFSRERAFLKQADMNASVISSKSRMKISKIREMDWNKAKQSVTGQRVETKTVSGYKKYNRNISHLHNIYKERLNQVRQSQS